MEVLALFPLLALIAFYLGTASRHLERIALMMADYLDHVGVPCPDDNPTEQETEKDQNDFTRVSNRWR